jgi:1-deoxy-D-xylulose-5-phosphate reductoisomerase
MKKIAILGSTGSIGRSALELIDLHPELFEVVALAAGGNDKILHEQCLKYKPAIAALNDHDSAERLSSLVSETTVYSGIEGMTEVSCCPDADIVISAISGAPGLIPTYQALKEGKKVALANKEALVMAGELIMPMLQTGRGSLVPVDSEHSAIHQCLCGAPRKEVQRLILTASGGPFLDYSAEDIGSVTVKQALQHPTWSMGPKITVDSATLMNKGLEVIEAHHLFQIEPEYIDVIIHPQSVVHSIVEFMDGTMLAQMGITDMKIPILYAMTYPKRIKSKLPGLDIASLPGIEFRAPDTELFPCLKLAYQALSERGTGPAVMNAANEIAVGSFLSGSLRFTDIPKVIERVLNKVPSEKADSLETVISADNAARKIASDQIAGLTG